MAKTIPTAVYPAKLTHEPEALEPFVDPQRRITSKWHRWTVMVDQAIRRFAKFFTFLELEDTPDSYSGQSLKAVRVNSGETALEFYVPTTYTDEQVMDVVAAMIQNGTGISWSYNDAGNTLTPTVSLAPFSTTNLAEGANLYFTDERAQDAIAAALVAGSNITITYNDGANTITIAATGGTAASTTEILTGTDSAKFATPDAIAALWEQGANVASASTVSLGEGGFFHITGTTGITDIDFATDKAGRMAWVCFDGILTLTHNASTLILPTAANIITAAGDRACIVSEGSDVVRCLAYTRADGTPLAGSSGAPVGAQYVTLATDGTLTNERVLTAGAGVTLTDNGAGSTLVIAASAGVAGSGLFRGIMSTTIPTASGLGFSTWLNQGATTETDISGGMLFTGTGANGGSNKASGLYKAVPSTPYTLNILVLAQTTGLNNGGVLVGWYDGTNKLQTVYWDTTNTFEMQFSAPGTMAAANSKTNFSWPWLWVQLSDDGTNYAIKYSITGFQWSTIVSGTKSGGYLGSSGYNNIFLGIDDFSTARQWLIHSYG